MKRLSAAQRERQQRFAKLRHRAALRRYREEQRRKARLRGSGGRPLNLLVIPAPATFSLDIEDNRQPLLAFLATLREPFIQRRTGTILVDMHRVNRCVADGMLLFFAEVSRLLAIGRGSLRIRVKPPVNQRADHVLCQIGLYTLCGMDRTQRRKSPFGDVVHWRSAQGHYVDNSICAAAIEEHEGQLAQPLVDGLFRGLGEAMTNTKHHAYLGTRPDGLNHTPPGSDWWMFSQARDGYLSVVFCDLGVGIPVTLPLKKQSLWSRLVNSGLSQSDAACIEEAVEDTRTRTNLAGRGHGLGNIVDVVSQYSTGNVVILSNRGCYSLRNGKSTRYDFRDTIMGTMISWRVPLHGASNGATSSD